MMQHATIGTSPQAIGDGYQQQLAAMNDKERVKAMQVQQFAANVSSPARQKQLQQQDDENALERNGYNMLNQRAVMAQDYHSRVRNEHKQLLFEQMNSDKRQRQAADQAVRDNDAAQAQRVGYVNNQFNQQRSDNKSIAMNHYKDSLDQQIQSRRAMKAYGNMTNVEKEMNKDELIAYKNHDRNEVTMIPG